MKSLRSRINSSNSQAVPRHLSLPCVSRIASSSFCWSGRKLFRSSWRRDDVAPAALPFRPGSPSCAGAPGFPGSPSRFRISARRRGQGRPKVVHCSLIRGQIRTPSREIRRLAEIPVQIVKLRDRRIHEFLPACDESPGAGRSRCSDKRPGPRRRFGPRRKHFSFPKAVGAERPWSPGGAGRSRRPGIRRGKDRNARLPLPRPDCGDSRTGDDQGNVDRAVISEEAMGHFPVLAQPIPHDRRSGQ